MMIEFIGPTGAGKTTVISRVRRKLAEQVEVASSFECLAEPLRLGSVTHPTAQNVIQELVGLPFFARSLRRHKPFVVFALKMMARHRSFTRFTINYLRSLERTLGVYEAIRAKEEKRIILVDEGTVLQAHSLFVFTSTIFAPEEIREFASLVPLPDIIVYVTAPVESLVARTLQRTDPPKEMRSRDQALIEQYAHRAVRIFEQLVKAEPIRSRVVTVENLDSTDGCASLVNHIVERIADVC